MIGEMNNDYATQIVNNLEKSGESKDYIIGFLTATINCLKYVDSKEVQDYLTRSVEQSKQTR